MCDWELIANAIATKWGGLPHWVDYQKDSKDPGYVTDSCEREITQALREAYEQGRKDENEACLAVYELAFENNWVVQDTIDAIKERPNADATRVTK